MAQLVIVDPEGAEQQLSIGAGECVIGRDPGLTVTLPDRKVSRRHARIFSDGGEYFVEDMGSANGVIVGDKPITKATRLTTGTEMTISRFRIRFLGDEASEGGGTTFSLIGLGGPVQDQTFILPEGDLEVGRGEQNAIVIADASLSRKHAVLQVTAAGIVVEDLDSSNGTFVNGVRVGRRALAPGDRLRFGNVELELASSAEPAVQRLLGLSLGDRSVQLAVGMGAVALLLLLATTIIVVRRPGGGARRSMEELYEQQIVVSLTNAAEQMRRQAWDEALRSYAEVLDRDPINPEARKGALEAEGNRDHARRLEAAKRILGSQPEEALRPLAGIPRQAFYGAAAAALLQQAQEMVAAQALTRARESCKRREYKLCHDSLVLHLDNAPGSGEGRALLAEAEAALRKEAVAFTPWLPPG